MADVTAQAASLCLPERGGGGEEEFPMEQSVKRIVSLELVS